MKVFVWFCITIFTAILLYIWIPNVYVADKEPNVVTTTYMLKDLVEEIVGSEVTVEHIIPPALDPHGYSLLRNDVEKMKNAGLLICNGLGLEHSSSMLKIFATHQNLLNIGSYLLSLHNNGDISLLFHEGVIDPHIWLNLELWAKCIPCIVAQLVKTFPNKAELFKENATKLQQKYISIHNEIHTGLSVLRQNNFKLVSAHLGLSYFVQAYLISPTVDVNLDLYYVAPEGFVPDRECSILDIERVANFVHDNSVKYLFSEYGMKEVVLNKIADVVKSKYGQQVEVIKNKELWSDSCNPDKGVCSVPEWIQHNANVILTQYM